jgi:drug/metabolite transporter (DMT)-like permease
LNLTVGTGLMLAAGLLWGSVFVVPALLHEYPPVILAASRYLAFGLIAIPLALASRHAIAMLGREDWMQALQLTLVGNLLYYALIAAAVQLAGPPLPTMIIGCLPVAIAIAANIASPSLSWQRLALPLAVMAAGIALVNHDELQRLGGRESARLLAGALLSLGALACWIWYPLRNTAWLRKRPDLRADVWATAQGLATLPLALIAWLAAAPFGDFDWPLGPRPTLFAATMLAIAIGSSWLGGLCWNRASRLLPTPLLGQLIVFETLCALALGFAWRGEWPGAATLAGIVLLVCGVVLGIRALR